jgi:hypothetical protein
VLTAYDKIFTCSLSQNRASSGNYKNYIYFQLVDWYGKAGEQPLSQFLAAGRGN